MRERKVRAETRPAARASDPPSRRRTGVRLTSSAQLPVNYAFAVVLEEDSELAHHASALKQMRQGVKHQERNRKNVSQLKTQVKKLRAAIAKGDADEAKKLPRRDGGRDRQAAKKGVVHDNAAARYKSRLTRQVNALAARGPSPPAASPPQAAATAAASATRGVAPRLDPPVGPVERRQGACASSASDQRARRLQHVACTLKGMQAQPRRPSSSREPAPRAGRARPRTCRSARCSVPRIFSGASPSSSSVLQQRQHVGRASRALKASASL